MSEFDDVLGEDVSEEDKKVAEHELGSIYKEDTGDEILLRVPKSIILDMFSYFGVDGLVLIGQATADMLSEEVVKVVEDNKDKIKGRFDELQKKLEEIKC